MLRRQTRLTNGLNYYQEKNTFNFDGLKNAAGWLIYTIVPLFLAVGWVLFMGFRVRTADAAMEPTIIEKQNVFINKLAFKLTAPQVGDVIAYYPGGNTDMAPQVRRVVAIPGNKVQIDDGILLINGIPAPGIDDYELITDPGIAAQVVTLGSNEYFVLGDNRNNSEDSRKASIGPVNTDDIIGKAWIALPTEGTGFSFIQ